VFSGKIDGCRMPLMTRGWSVDRRKSAFMLPVLETFDPGSLHAAFVLGTKTTRCLTHRAAKEMGRRVKPTAQKFF
jgi:hypothetical protein